MSPDCGSLGLRVSARHRRTIAIAHTQQHKFCPFGAPARLSKAPRRRARVRPEPALLPSDRTSHPPPPRHQEPPPDSGDRLYQERGDAQSRATASTGADVPQVEISRTQPARTEARLPRFRDSASTVALGFRAPRGDRVRAQAGARHRKQSAGSDRGGVERLAVWQNHRDRPLTQRRLQRAEAVRNLARMTNTGIGVAQPPGSRPMAAVPSEVTPEVSGGARSRSSSTPGIADDGCVRQD